VSRRAIAYAFINDIAVVVCRYSHSMTLQLFNRFVCLFVCLCFPLLFRAAGRSKEIFSLMDQCEQRFENAECHKPHGNPLLTGYKYNFTNSREQFHCSWHLPAAASEDIDFQRNGGVDVESSCTGCTKQRVRIYGHGQRSGLWIWVCMVHKIIVGFHIMPQSEGRRDAIFSLFRYRNSAPSTIWLDFACGVEESALNWLPGPFQNVQFYHDVFHGVSHKCSSRFESKRFAKHVSKNTSLVEEVNCSIFRLP
jgi:hypothetical protein